MTLDEMRQFLELADRQGVRGNTPVMVVINGAPGVYEITASNVASSITQTPTLGIQRQSAGRSRAPIDQSTGAFLPISEESAVALGLLE